MTKIERIPDIDAEEIIEMFRPEMRRLKPADVGLERVPDAQHVTSEPSAQTATTQPTDTTVTTEQPAQTVSNRVGAKQQRATLEATNISPSAENREPQTRLREL